MLTALVMFFATFVQGSAGFGMALVSMPLLVGVLGVRTATPLVALLGSATEIIMLVRYREAFNWRAVARLSAASLVGIPLGVVLLGRLDEQIVTTALGVVIIGYAIYALAGPALPQLAHRAWAYSFGFVAGLLSGAYNTSGPAVVMYGSCRRWLPAEFKSNLQGFFLFNSVMVLLVHGLSGNFTPVVWHNFLLGMPTAVLGLLAGFCLDRRLNPQLFRRIVLVLLLVLGVRLLI